MQTAVTNKPIPKPNGANNPPNPLNSGSPGTFRNNNPNNKILKPTTPMPSAPPPKFNNQLGPRPNIPPPLPGTPNPLVVNKLNQAKSNTNVTNNNNNANNNNNNANGTTTPTTTPPQTPTTEPPAINVNPGTLRNNNSGTMRNGKNSSRCYTINNNQLMQIEEKLQEEQNANSATAPGAGTKTIHSIINMFQNDKNLLYPLIPKRDETIDAQMRRTSKRPLTEEEAMARISGTANSDFLQQRISSRRSNMQSSENNNDNNDPENAQPVNPLEWWRQESTFYEYCSVDGTPIEPDGTRVRALWDFNAEKITDLSFNKGDIITIIRRYSNGWWEGELNGFIGDFPCNFVEEVDKDVDDEDTSRNDANNNNSLVPSNNQSNQANNNNGGINGEPKYVFSILQPLKQGFLTKKGQKRRNWKVRYFILEHGKISYYVAPNDHVQKKPLCTIVLLKSTVVKLAPEMKKSNCFAILSVRKPYTLYITAPTGEEMVSWMDCIELARGDGSI